jgi:hypothetical protein
VQQVADDRHLEAGDALLVRRIVKASSSAWVGCSCMPSPALMMRAWQIRDSRWAAPDDECRITIMSGDIASRLSAVSTSVSPLVTLEVATAMLSVSALSRFSAISNDVRVRVLGSKNRLTTVRPRSAGHLLDRPRADFLHRLGGVEDQDDLLGDSSSMPRRCRARSPGEAGLAVDAGDGVGVSIMAGPRFL